MTQPPYITHDENDRELPLSEAYARSAQVAREEADCLDHGEERDAALAKAEEFEAEAARHAAQANVTVTVLGLPTEKDRDEIAQLTDAPPEPVPTRLVYAPDITPGMTVVAEKPCPHRGLLPVALVGEHDHGYVSFTVVEVRQGEGAMSHVYSAIVLDEKGVQQPMTWHSVELVRVKDDHIPWA